MLKPKGEVFKKFVEWINMTERSSGQKVKTLCNDNGEFIKYQQKVRVHHQYCFKTTESNVGAKVMNWTLIETLPKILWFESPEEILGRRFIHSYIYWKPKPNSYCICRIKNDTIGIKDRLQTKCEVFTYFLKLGFCSHIKRWEKENRF